VQNHEIRTSQVQGGPNRVTVHRLAGGDPAEVDTAHHHANAIHAADAGGGKLVRHYRGHRDQLSRQASTHPLRAPHQLINHRVLAPVEGVVVDGVHDDRHPGEPGSDAAHDARLVAVGVDDVG